MSLLLPEEVAAECLSAPAEYGKVRGSSFPLPRYVYFLESESGLIKIGSSLFPSTRLANCQTGNHERLRLIGQFPGGKRRETVLHEHLGPHRERGEWYHPDGRVVHVVEILCAYGEEEYQRRWAQAFGASVPSDRFAPRQGGEASCSTWPERKPALVSSDRIPSGMDASEWSSLREKVRERMRSAPQKRRRRKPASQP